MSNQLHPEFGRDRSHLQLPSHLSPKEFTAYKHELSAITSSSNLPQPSSIHRLQHKLSAMTKPKRLTSFIKIAVYLHAK